MKIVIIPGVGYQKGNIKENYLGKSIQKEVQCEFEIFNWDHRPIKNAMRCMARIHELKGMAYNSLRNFVTEIIFDFEFAIKYGGSIRVPDADYYIGHSAGSLFAMAQDKPSTMMGSPLALVKYLPKVANVDNAFIDSILDSDKSVLNIINKYDILAYPMDDLKTKNVYFRGFMFNPVSYFPLTAHLCYWKNKFVSKEIIKHIKSVVK